nr:putative ribonuclease H-like domain-containing protein [Tanacetum cinerariifolium]
MVAAAKLLVLNPSEFKLWKMRIEQYFLMMDYALWEVIVNGDSPPPKRTVDGKGYHAVPPPYTGNFMPPKSDLILVDVGEYVVSETVISVPTVATNEAKTSESKPKSISEPIIEDWVSNSDDENETETKSKQRKPSFTKGNPQLELQEKRVIGSRFSRHMTRNMSYLFEYEEIDGGYVAFGRDPKGGKITDIKCIVLYPDFKILDESQVLLRVPRKNNMYSVDLKNVAPLKGLTCLFAKAILDESNLWHRWLEDINFKTINKLMRGNLVRGIKREFSVSRTPKKNGVVKRKSRTPIEAARTMLADSKLHTTFWAEAVNTACYVQNRVLVIKPYNKIPYELFHGRTPSLSFMRPFRCHVTILNTLDPLGSGPTWLFDIKTLTKTMNYKPIVAGNQSNGSAVPRILLVMDLNHQGKRKRRMLKIQGIKINSQTDNADGTKDNTIDKNIIYGCADDLNISNLEEIVYSDDDEDVGAEADITNLDTNILFSPIRTTKIHKDHPAKQIIGDIHLAPQTRRMTKNVTNHGFKDLEFPNRVYKVEKALYGLHQAPRAWKEMCTEFEKMMHKKFQLSSMGELTFFLGLQVTQKDDGIFIGQDKIFRYLKGQPKLGLWYPKDSPFNLEAYIDSDYADASLDRKSTTGGCQFLRKRLISWQCKKQTVVGNSTTEVKYVVSSNCCGQVLWIQNQMLDYGYNFMNTKMFIDNKSTICIVNNPVFHSKNKHIKIRHHFIRDSYEKRLIQVIKIHINHNVADLLIKAFDVSIFHYLIATAKDKIKVNTGNSSVNAVGHYLVLSEIVDFLNANPIRYALTDKGDRVEMAATTAASLDAEQESGTINRTQSMAIPNEPIPQGTGSGGSPKYQDTILGDRPAQTRFERLSKQSYKPPLSRVNTLGSGEDNMQLMELMELCTQFSDKVLALENKKTSQDLEINHLKKRVKRLEKKRKSRTSQLKRRNDQDEGISFVQDDVKIQGRYGHDTEINTASTSITNATINITTAETITTISAPITTAGVSVSTFEPSTPPPTITSVNEDKDLIISQTLMKMRTIEEKVHIEHDEKVSRNFEAQLQAKLEEEERLARQKEEEANIALIAKWYDVQAMMDADHVLAKRLQAEEQGELTIEERSKLFLELMNERKKHFAILRAEEKRRKPPTKAQKRNPMCTYLKNMAGFTHIQLKNKGFKEFQKAFDNTMSWINLFVPMDSEVVKDKAKGSSKRARKELESHKSKKQKLDEKVEAKEDNDQEAEMKMYMKIVFDDEVAIDDITLAIKPVIIVDWKIIKEGKISSYHIIRADGSSKGYSSLIKML